MSSQDEVPSGDVTNNDYVSRPGQKDVVPVQSDDAPVEDADPAADDAQAVDQDNIMDSRTRDAAPEKGAYTEPGDREGLPENDGRSRIAQ